MNELGIWNVVLSSTYQIAVFQLEELFGTLVLMHGIIVLNNAFPIRSSLLQRS